MPGIGLATGISRLLAKFPHRQDCLRAVRSIVGATLRPERDDRCMQSPTDVFGPDGLLARHLPDFRYRAPQERMAALIGEAIDAGSHAVLEAGTGIGKTFAYLIPVLGAGRRAIVSTGTRTLQDQIFERDLPLLGRVLGRPVEVAMLKGRSNYLCQHRLLRALGQRGERREVRDRLQALRLWSRETVSGDLAELDEIREDYRTTMLATSTADNCLGSRCEHFDECFVGRARRRAQAAQVVVVNHHLLLADLALKDGGFGELLPDADVVIADEAHLLPDIAQQFFGVAMSSREVEYLAADIEDEARLRTDDRLAGDAAILRRAAAGLRPAAGADAGRMPWRMGRAALRDAVARLAEPLGSLRGHVDALAQGDEAGAVLERCAERLQSLEQRFSTVTGSSPDDGLRWFDITERTVTVHLTPFDVARSLAARIESQGGSWVFLSATLAVGDDFEHFVTRIGVDPPIREALPSPFDYRSNARLYLPDGLPAPGEPDHVAAFIDTLLPLIEASGGGAFILFTSFRALGDAEARLRGRPLPGPLFVQGSAPRSRLLDAFREAGNGVLLGTGSFWQGVDVRGPALRIVAIDKLPFAVPSDPIVQARSEALRREGVDPFTGFQLPQAVLALKQGVGRLIRDYDDRGLVVLGDARLRTKAYGRAFLQSLPPMPVLEAQTAALDFAGTLASRRIGEAADLGTGAGVDAGFDAPSPDGPVAGDAAPDEVAQA